MRFRRRVKVFPGVHLNFSKSGISTTIGVPGLSFNLSNAGTFLNTGIPGTGFYDRKRIDGPRENQLSPVQPNELESQLNQIQSGKAESITSDNLQGLKSNLIECNAEKHGLIKEIVKAKINLTLSTIWMGLSYVLIIGIFVKWFKELRKNDKQNLDDLNNQLKNCYVPVEINLDSAIEENFFQLVKAFKGLCGADRIWDVTGSMDNNQKVTRLAANELVSRKPVKFSFGKSDIINSTYDPLHFENANGGQLYIYPAFIAVFDSKDNFGLIDIRDLRFDFEKMGFMETSNAPNDANIADYTWAKVNKNGSPDMRFKDNYQIPIYLYGEFHLRSKSGLNEAYMVSNYESAEYFAVAFRNFQASFSPFDSRNSLESRGNWDSSQLV